MGQEDKGQQKISRSKKGVVVSDKGDKTAKIIKLSHQDVNAKEGKI